MSCRCRLVSQPLSPLVIWAVGCCVLPLPPCLPALIFGVGLLCPAAAALFTGLVSFGDFCCGLQRELSGTTACAGERAESSPPLLHLIWLRFKTIVFVAYADVILVAFRDGLEWQAIEGPMPDTSLASVIVRRFLNVKRP